MAVFKFPNLTEEKSILKTIRIKSVTIKKIEKLSKQSNFSVNRLINECIDFALNNMNNKK